MLQSVVNGLPAQIEDGMNQQPPEHFDDQQGCQRTEVESADGRDDPLQRIENGPQ